MAWRYGLGFGLIAGGIALFEWSRRSYNNSSALYDRMLEDMTEPGLEPRNTSEGRAIHVSGKLNNTSTRPCSDDLFTFIQNQNAAEIKRSIEMFQWNEKKTESKEQKDGNIIEKKEYKYTTEWFDKSKSSKEYHIQQDHVNPSWNPVLSNRTSYIATALRLGKWQFEDHLFKRIARH